MRCVVDAVGDVDTRTSPPRSPRRRSPRSLSSTLVSGVRARASSTVGPGRPREMDARPHRRDGEASRSSGRGGLRPPAPIRAATDEVPQFADRRLLARADVDDEPTAALARPHEGVDHVVDEHEVAGLASVAVHDRRRRSRRPRPERGDDAPVGPLARAVHRGQRQGRELDRRTVAVESRAGRRSTRATTPRTPRGSAPPPSPGSPAVPDGRRGPSPGSADHHLDDSVMPARLEDRRDHASAGRPPAATVRARQRRQGHDHLGPADADQRVDVGAAGIQVMDLQALPRRGPRRGWRGSRWRGRRRRRPRDPRRADDRRGGIR